MSGNYINAGILASTEWLADHIDDSDIRVVDCDPFQSYTKAHIKGAVGIKVHHYIKHPNYDKDPGSYPWVAEPDVVKDLFESMGIGDNTTVVCYDTSGGLWAARFWWVLNYYGHNNAKVLDGGWQKWMHENRPVSIDRPIDVDVTFTPKANNDLICTIDDLKSNLDNEDYLIIDARADGEWDGTNDRGNKRSGRVPGAIHIEWLNFINRGKDKTFKTPEQIFEILNKAGVDPEKQIVTY